ncbi:MAG TPA: nucleotidyltransferase family protein [Dissulfurispiraceae bacterium]|nr:nucleotidyltransferase family protein [Dissulfurispiraceae bacterium]
MSAQKNLAAIILSAGYSSRMQDFKPLLTLCGSTIIEKAISAFVEADIADITVVLGNRADDIRQLLERLHIKWTFNADYNLGMFSSVSAGIRSLNSEVEGVFLLPADIPLVKSSSIRLMIKAYEGSEALVLYPVNRKQRGHPPLISSKLFPEILTWNGIGGLQKLLERHENKALEVDVQDEGILLDIDTPDDYEKICSMIKVHEDRQ